MGMWNRYWTFVRLSGPTVSGLMNLISRGVACLLNHQMGVGLTCCSQNAGSLQKGPSIQSEPEWRDAYCGHLGTIPIQRIYRQLRPGEGDQMEGTTFHTSVVDSQDMDVLE